MEGGPVGILVALGELPRTLPFPSDNLEVRRRI